MNRGPLPERCGRVKNIFDLWREHDCQLPLRVTRGWSHSYYVTVVRVVPEGKYGVVYGYGNTRHRDPVQRRYWGDEDHVVAVSNAGCGGWSIWHEDLTRTQEQ